MSEIVYTSESELRHPQRFFAQALADLRRAPGVAWRLFRSHTQARNRRTALGYLWLLLPTLATTLIWVYVQSRRIIAIETTAIPYPIYVLTGMICWQVFVDALNAPLQQLTAARQTIARSRVPHEALLVAGVFDVLLNCAVRLLVLAAALIAFQMKIAATALLMPLGLIALATLGFALGLLAAPLGMLYDDVGRSLLMITSFWFFLTPVIYPTPATGIVRFNPVTPLLDTTRSWLLGGPAANGFAVVMIFAIATLIVAWLFHRLARPHLVARLG
jgi:lipopolysaccharide transport system permease protein